MRRTAWLRYGWAAPWSALGVVLGFVVLVFGGAAQRHAGTLEFSGGVLGRWIGRLPPPFAFGAITLGHVILAIDVETLAALRRHERVHVAQYERWGPFFVPAYLLSSAWQLLLGRNPYRENHFERQAVALSAPRRAQG